MWYSGRLHLDEVTVITGSEQRRDTDVGGRSELDEVASPRRRDCDCASVRRAACGAVQGAARRMQAGTARGKMAEPEA